MVKVKINPGKGLLIMDGHAGFGAAGSDIVCSGISAIVQALEYNLELDKDSEKLELELIKRSGFLRIEAKPREAWRQETEKKFRYTANALRMIKEEYPRAIRIHEEG